MAFANSFLGLGRSRKFGADHDDCLNVHVGLKRSEVPEPTTRIQFDRRRDARGLSLLRQTVSSSAMLNGPPLVLWEAVILEIGYG